MRIRSAFMILVTAILLVAVSLGVTQALEKNQTHPTPVVALANVRDFAPAPSVAGLSYAVESGMLYAGSGRAWQQVVTPHGVIVNAVTLDRTDADVIYIGAANELAIYRSLDQGESWLRVPLSETEVGAVTDMAVDSANRLVYVGTDTAGVYRLRDVGSSMVSGGHLKLDEAILQVATDGSGAGLTFVRTAWNLYRAEDTGLTWHPVDNLHSVPTALAIAHTNPVRVYVGTADRGVLESVDGRSWQMANEGLGLTAGSRLFVDALAVDPAQPEVVYVATSFLFGSTQVHSTPQGVAMMGGSGQDWTALTGAPQLAVVELMPVSGYAGAVYGLTSSSRTPIAMGSAGALESAAAVAALQAETQPEIATADSAGAGNDWLAWLVAGLAGLTLLFAVGSDLLRRRQAGRSAQRKPAFRSLQAGRR